MRVSPTVTLAPDPYSYNDFSLLIRNPPFHPLHPTQIHRQFPQAKQTTRAQLPAAAQQNVEQGYSAASAIPHASSSYWCLLLFMYVGYYAGPLTVES